MTTEAVELKTVKLIDRRTWDYEKKINLYQVPWVCSFCGGPRGEITEYTFTEHGQVYICDTWTNPCGHRELHEHALKDAAIPIHKLPVREIFNKLAETTGMRLRPSQVDLAEGVEETYRSDQWALMEAGTGTGKSKGYLVPLVASGVKATISTATKSLQDQVFFKDLQEVMKDLNVKRKVVLLKGANNYLCKFRTEAMALTSDSAAEEAQQLIGWLAENPDGDLNNYPKEIQMGWGNVNVDTEACFPKKCPHSASCPWVSLKNQVAQSDIIVTNHSLLFYSKETRDERFVVIDEGHEIPKVASSVLSIELNLRKMLDDLSNLASYGDARLSQFRLSQDMITLWMGKLNGIALQISKQFKSDTDRVITSQQIFDGINLNLDQKITLPSNEPGEEYLFIETTIREMIAVYVAEQPMENLSKRLQALLKLRDFIESQSQERADLIRYVEKNNDTLTFRIGYKHIGPHLDYYLWSNPNIKGGSLLSASFKHNGYFNYMLEKLKLPQGTPTLEFPSPFDYNEQARFYMPPTDTMKLPKDAGYRQWLAEEIYRIVTTMNGRSVILFTSYRQMAETYEDLKDVLPFNCLVQGADKPNSVLKQEFLDDTHSVLFATKSFWTGFDAPGETLSCVIIPTIPFPQVGDPYVQGISDTLVNPLIQYMVPEASLELHQGTGRLIRTENDYGVIALLDKRLSTAGYAPRFFASMPAMPMLRSLDEVSAWMKSKQN